MTSKALERLAIISAQNKAFSLTPGSAVIPRLIRANGYWDMARVEASFPEAHSQMVALGEEVNFCLPGSEIKIGDFKDTHKIADKIEREKSGDYGLLTDGVRMTITIDNSDDLSFISNNINPKNNPQIIHVEDSFARENKENGQKRMKILMRTDTGLIAEIMVRHRGLDACDDITRTAYEVCKMLRPYEFNGASENEVAAEAREKIEDLLNQITSDMHALSYDRFFEGGIDFENKSIDEIRTLCNHIRRHLPLSLSNELGLNDLVIDYEERSFFSVAGMPVLIMPDPYRDDKMIAVRPDAESNSYVIDNEYLDLIRSDSHSAVDMTDHMSLEEARDKFIEMSVTMVNNYNETVAELSSNVGGAEIISLSRYQAMRSLGLN